MNVQHNRILAAAIVALTSPVMCFGQATTQPSQGAQQPATQVSGAAAAQPAATQVAQSNQRQPVTQPAQGEGQRSEQSREERRGGDRRGRGDRQQGSTTQQARNGQRQPDFREQYGVITDNNIFMRERRARQEGPTTRQEQRSPEQQFILTGVVIEDGEPRAFFEDRSRGGFVKIGVGERVARGLVAEIAIDAIQFEMNGELSWISVGNDLTGRTVIATGRPSGGSGAGGAGAPAASGGTPAPLPDPNSPNLSAADRMRLRRAGELNRPPQPQ